MSAVLSLWRGTIGVRPQAPTMRALALEVARTYGLGLPDLVSRNRSRRVSNVRQEAMWVLRQTGRYSTTKIGVFFERDHTTVLHGCRAHSARVAGA